MSAKNVRESAGSNSNVTRSPGDKNKYDQYNLNSKLKTDGNDEYTYGKSHKNDNKSISRDDGAYQEKYQELSKQVKEFYEKFRDFVMQEDLKEKLNALRDNEDDPFLIVKYSNHLLKLLVNSKKEEESVRNKSMEGDYLNDYELLLQKAENDIRQHIRIEQQLKLLIETMQSKLEEYERNKDNISTNAKSLLKEAQTDNAKLIEMIKQKDIEIENVNKTVKQKMEMIKSHEERLLTITVLEHKIKNLREKYEKELEDKRRYYEQEFANLTKEIAHIHKVLTVNLANDEKIKLLHRELTSYKEFNLKKIQYIESKMKGLDEFRERQEDSGGEQDVIRTEPDATTERRKSLRPSTSSSLVKSKAYDLVPHRHSTEIKNEKSSTYKQFINKKKGEIANEINVLSITRIKDLHQKQQQQQSKDAQKKPAKEFENYFKYFSNKLDTLQQANEKEKEQLRSFDGRRSSSLKRGGSSNGAIPQKKEKSFDRNSKENLYKSGEEMFLNSERLSHTNSNGSNNNKNKPSPALHKSSSHNKFKNF